MAQRHAHAGAGGEFHLEVVAEVILISLERLDQQKIDREPNRAAPVGIAAEQARAPGLWLVQECRRAWSREGADYTYEELTRLAAEASPFAAVIDPDAFAEPGAMPGRIAAFCRHSGQEPPRSHAQTVRVILESLALRYREVLEGLERLTSRKIETIHIVGGGARNGLLNQLVADCTQRRVVVGPYEAAATGNILIQAMDLREARAVVRRSFATRVVEPRPNPEWDRAYERLRGLAGENR